MIDRQKHTPSLNDLIDYRIKQLMTGMFCNGLGTIQAFDAETQQATISMNYKRKVKGYDSATNNIDRKDKIFDYPLLLKCPVIFLTGGDARLTLPVTVGDTCVIFFNDRDIDTWIETGIVDNPPNSNRVHSVADAIALVGIRSNANPLADFNTAIASFIDKSGERLAQSGDTKTSFKTANHSGWLILDGSTIGDAGSGADYEGEEYEELFNIVKESYPNLGSEVFGSTVVFLPDMRGRSSLGVDNMGGSQAGILTTTYTPNRNVLGGLSGEESHQLTVAELAEHRHTTYRAVNTTGELSGSDGWRSGTQTFTAYTGYEGDDTPHNTVHPSVMMYWFIKI